jgi:hypothetical protein
LSVPDYRYVRPGRPIDRFVPWQRSVIRWQLKLQDTPVDPRLVGSCRRQRQGRHRGKCRCSATLNLSPSPEPSPTI